MQYFKSKQVVRSLSYEGRVDILKKAASENQNYISQNTSGKKIKKIKNLFTSFRVFVCCFFLDTEVMFDIDMTYFLTAIGLTPGGSSTVHIYTQTIHRTTQLKCIEQQN